MMNLDKITPENKIATRRWLTIIIEMLMYNTFVVYLVLAVLLGPLNAKHGWSIEAMLLVYTLFMVMAAPCSIIAGKIRDLTGDRTIILLGAVVYGIGCIIAGLTSSLTVFFIMIGVLVAFGTNASIIGFNHNIGVLFPDKPAFSLGLFYTGCSLLSMAIIPLCAYLIGILSVTAVLIGFGVFAIVLCIILSVLIAVPPENYAPKGWNPQEMSTGEQAGSGVDINWKKLLVLPSAYLIIIAFICTDLIVEALNSNFSLIAQEMANMDEMQAALMGSFLSFGSAIGSLVIGAIAEKVGTTRTMALVAGLAGIVVLIGILIGVNVPIFSAIAIVVGLSMGAMMVLMPAITMECYGEKNFGLNYGIIRVSLLVAALIGPQLTVRMPLNLCFIICATASVIAMFIFFWGDKSAKNYIKRI